NNGRFSPHFHASNFQAQQRLLLFHSLALELVRRRHRNSRYLKPAFPPPNAVTISASASSATAIPRRGAGRPKTVVDQDPIAALNERIRRDYSKKEAASIPTMDSEETDRYLRLVKERQQQGLLMLKGRGKKGENNQESAFFSYKVDPQSLHIGDYVVHRKVGIGRFVGIKPDVPKGSSAPVDYVFIEYADGMAKLPLKQASRLLYRYTLPDEKKKTPGLSKLRDTSVWEKRKAKGKVAIQKMVVDLMELYLHRLRQKRPPYPKSPDMAGFAALFPHEPTPDQKQAFMDVEKDLTEKETPMDRLICGDVGFGKTEVMVLAPTVVLARQHFHVISDRFSKYSNVKVGLYTRFQARAEKLKYLDMIKHGHLDIIVGTHSLLGSQVEYNNLGLLVIDEEQFDCNSTSRKVLGAIKYELDRGGQVFYVLPRIKGLEEVKDYLEESFPDAKVAIVHGQQKSKLLEDTMGEFAEGEIKILISTNIVESGLDIQNANTIIIQDLRGRVGRAGREAHAYLFYSDTASLTPAGRERLKALEECGELGQGFQVAEKDMGIRGFGNIFGEQQSGDVGNVGSDLFFEMLFESLSKVEELRVVSVPYQSVQIDLNVNPHLPSDYINYLENPMEIVNEAERAAKKDAWSLMQFTENLRRQYGKEPYAMEILLKKLYVRRMAADLGINRIYASGKMVGLKTNMSKKVFDLMVDSMTSDAHRNALVYDGEQIKVCLLG
ncbi:hypothetical protein Tsubulata_037900, partial [Turnera subulata]